MTKPDLKGKTIEIAGQRFLVLSCTFRQPGNGDAAGFALLLLTEKGQLHHTMVGIEPITLIDGPRPIAAGSFADLAHRTQVKSMIAEAAVADAAKGIAAAQWIERGTAPADADRGRAEWSSPPDDVVRRRVQRQGIAGRHREELEASRALTRQAVSDLSAARNEIGNLQRSRDSADEQVRIMSEALAASNGENAKLVDKVDRLEHEIALVTKHATIMPELPPGVVERDGQLWRLADDRHSLEVAVPADDFLTRNMWARRLVAERNAARETAIALDRRIAALTRTMATPVIVQPVQTVPALWPTPPSCDVRIDGRDAAGNSVTASNGAESPYKRD